MTEATSRATDAQVKCSRTRAPTAVAQEARRTGSVTASRRAGTRASVSCADDAPSTIQPRAGEVMTSSVPPRGVAMIAQSPRAASRMEVGKPSGYMDG